MTEVSWERHGMYKSTKHDPEFKLRSYAISHGVFLLLLQVVQSKTFASSIFPF